MQLITILQAQAIIASPIFGMRFPAIAVTHEFVKLYKVIQAELRTVDETRQKLIEECGGVLNEDKTLFTFTPEQAPAFQQGINDLMAVTFKVENFPMDLERIGSIELSPAELMQLEPLFDVPTETPAK
jgi:hypothetical protein